jgi:hypothetical protein
MQDGVVEFARDLERPERRPLCVHGGDIRRRIGFRRLDGHGGNALPAGDLDRDIAVLDAVLGEGAFERGQDHALTLAPPGDAAANSFERAATFASSREFGTVSSTRRHWTARRPLMPSSMVQK